MNRSIQHFNRRYSSLAEFLNREVHEESLSISNSTSTTDFKDRMLSNLSEINTTNYMHTGPDPFGLKERIWKDYIELSHESALKLSTDSVVNILRTCYNHRSAHVQEQRTRFLLSRHCIPQKISAMNQVEAKIAMFANLKSITPCTGTFTNYFKSRDNLVHNSLVTALVSQLGLKKPKAAWKYVKRFTKEKLMVRKDGSSLGTVRYTPSEIELKCLLLGYSNEGDTIKARKLYESIMQRQSSATIFEYNCLMIAQFMANQDEEALKVLAQARTQGVKFNEKTMIELVKHLSRDFIISNKILFEGLTEAHFTDAYTIDEQLSLMNFTANLDSLYLLLMIHSKGNNIYQIRNVFERLKSPQFEPDLHVYKSLLRAFSHCGQLNDVYCLLKEMKKRKVELDHIFLTQLMKVFAKHNRPNDSFFIEQLLMAQIQDSQGSPASQGSDGSDASQGSQDSPASQDSPGSDASQGSDERLLNDSRHRITVSNSPTKSSNVYNFNAIHSCQYFSPHTWAALIYAACKSGKLEKVNYYLECAEKECKKFQRTPHVFNIMLLACQFNHVEMRVIDNLTQEMTGRYGIVMDIPNFHMMIETMLKKKNYDLAEFWFQKYKQSGLKPHPLVYNLMLKMHLKRNNKAGTNQILVEMERLKMKADPTMLHLFIKMVLNTERHNMPRFYSPSDAREPKPVALGEASLSIPRTTATQENPTQLTVNNEKLSIERIIKIIDDSQVEKTLCIFLGVLKDLVNERFMNTAESLLLYIEKNCVFKPDLQVFDMMIRGFSNVDNITSSIDYYKRALAQPFEHDTQFFNAMLRSLAKVSHADYAMTVLDDMKRLGCPPNWLTYMALVDLSTPSTGHQTQVHIDIAEAAKVIKVDVASRGSIAEAFFKDSNITGMSSKTQIYANENNPEYQRLLDLEVGTCQGLMT